MVKPVEVICQFREDGRIMPIRIKVEDDEKQLQTYNIKRYKEPKTHLKTQPGYYSPLRHTPDIMDYECIINVFGVEKLIKLRYFVAMHKWDIVISN